MMTRFYRLLLLIAASLLFMWLGIFQAMIPFLDRATRRRLRAHCMTLWARTICAIFGVRVSVQGVPRDLEARFVVCNHSSYLDIPVVGSVLLGVFVSKHEVRRWPLIGWLASLAGTIYINRESKRDSLKALEEIREAIADGVDVIVFPEGTTTDGLEIRAFKSTLFDAPAALGIPVLPVTIRYAQINGERIEPGRMDEVAWHGDQSLLPHAWRLLGRRSIDVVVRLNPTISIATSEATRSLARKDLAKRTREEMQRGFDDADNRE